MLEDGEGGFGELGDEAYGGVDVEQVVVGNLLAVELFEEFVEFPEEISLLMGILAVAHCLLAVDCHAQGGGMLCQ